MATSSGAQMHLLIAIWWSLYVEKCSQLTMLSEQQLTVVNPGDTAVLECSFSSSRYNMFDYPVIWRKQQLDEWSQINVMGSINEPFAAAAEYTSSRFEVSFTAAAPVYHVELTILDLTREDSGNYTCEVRGPLSVSLGQVSHSLFVRDPVVRILLVDDSSNPVAITSSDYDIEHYVQQQQHSPSSIRAVENHPCRIRCVALGGYPPPSVEIHVGRREVTAEFGFRHIASLRSDSRTTGSEHKGPEVNGRRGLRTIDYRSERWTNNFLARAEDDEALMKCAAVVPGIKPAAVFVKLHVDFPPKISCMSVGAYVGERDVRLTCEVRAKPRMTSLFWFVDNGTTLSDHDVVDGYHSTVKDYIDGATVAQLQIRQTRPESFRLYTIVAENNVAVSAKDVQLYQRMRSAPSSYPLSDTSAITGHASHRESSREPRGRKTSSFSGAISSTTSNVALSIVVCNVVVAVIVTFLSNRRRPTVSLVVPVVRSYEYERIKTTPDDCCSINNPTHCYSNASATRHCLESLCCRQKSSLSVSRGPVSHHDFSNETHALLSLSLSFDSRVKSRCYPS